MLNSRAGLETKFSPQFRTYSIVLMMAMRIAPVLLLFIILCSTVVQAVPVPTHPITTVAARYGVSSHDSTQLQLTSGSAYTGSLHHPSPIHLSPSKSIATSKEETSMVALARRRSLGWKIRHAFHGEGNKLGHKIKHGFQKLGHAIKHAAQKVGHAIKHAAQKVGHFIKTTGAKIAKVGLKIAATVGKIAGKVVGFIPGAKGIGKAMEGGSEGLNKASDAIHAHIGGKLGKAMKRMDKAQKIVGYIP
ncbi:hypothetical protein D9619_011449 [Psilocybe cf. subviscida]|uniref:Uncharacterized protein n=1 Tax=Psilocybe cf. subviscida TaxID=2480587 RepID=A0A8H5BT95_9AGAR|nr:hypothetical protein D9619_011449 [Psilocybe cf. subviscida]